MESLEKMTILIILISIYLIGLYPAYKLVKKHLTIDGGELEPHEHLVIVVWPLMIIIFLFLFLVNLIPDDFFSYY